MKQIETKYVDKNPDINTNKKINNIDKAYLDVTNETKETKKLILQEPKKEEVNYDFIMKILKDNIGNEIDNFLRINMGQMITEYNADSFTRRAVITLKQSEQNIISEFKKINK